MTPTLLSCQRTAFSLEPGVHYLNCAFMGPLPVAAREAGESGVGMKSNPWRMGPADFFRESDLARGRFAAIVGGEASRIAIMPSVSYGVATAVRNLKLSAGDEILLLGEQFPGNVYSWRRAAAEAGARVVTVERPEVERSGDGTARFGATWNARILDAIGPRTRAVAVPPLHWTDGTRFDLAAIGARAREVGAMFVIDGTQAVGGTPIDVGALRPDLLVTGAYKWLLGPYSMAFAWIGERLLDGVPLEEGWIAREGSEDFQGLVDYVDGYQPGAIRYDVGERSNFALMPIAIASMDHILEWSPARIEAYVVDLSRPLIDAALELGFAVEEEAWRSRHLFGLRMPTGIDMKELKARLEEARVFVSLRGSAMRISPNVYNDENDVDALVDALRAAVRN